MPPDLQPVRRQSVPDAVVAQLESQILDGELAEGADLPGERALAEALGVSRPTVREALRRLQQRGLVEIRQGGATTVRDYRASGGLDLLPRLLLRGGRIDLDLIADIMAARSAIGPQIAAAAAGVAAQVDADDPRRHALRAAADAVATAAGPAAQQHAALAFWDAVVDLSGSMVYRLLYNGLRRAYEPALDALSQVLAPEIGDGTRHAGLAEAIDGGAPDAAQTAASALLTAGREAVLAVLTEARQAGLDGLAPQDAQGAPDGPHVPHTDSPDHPTEGTP